VDVDPALLRELRRERGWDVSDMARSVQRGARETRTPVPDLGILKGYIRRHERGAVRVSERYCLLYAKVLGVEMSELSRRAVLASAAATVPLAFAPDPGLFERVTRAVATPSRVDDATVGYFEQSIAGLLRAEDSLGGVPLWNTARGQLTDVASLARGSDGAQAARLVSLAAQYARLLGWMREAAGDYAAALAWYDRAHDWAIEAGDTDMTVTALSMKAELASRSGNPQRCTRLGNAALRYEKHVKPGVMALASAFAARGYADVKDTAAVERLLAEADRFAAAAASHTEDEPDYLYWVPATVPGARGVAEMLTGSHDAPASLTVAMRSIPESFSCDRIEYSACLARAHAQLGEAERAEDIAVRTAGPSADVPRAREELVRAARILDDAGATPQARAVREALAAYPVPV
jgi:hypothetical protein